MLGELAQIAKINRLEEEGRKKVEAHKQAYPGLKFADDEEEEKKEVPIEVDYFYIFKCNRELFSIYKNLRSYFSEYYALGPAIPALKELAKDKDVPGAKAIKLIPYIHRGYLSIVLEEDKTDGTKDNWD